MFQATLFLLASQLVFCIETQVTSYDIENASDYFNEFIGTYNKQYSGKEKEKRLKIFTENLEKCNNLNKMDGGVYGINKFSDLTAEEFKRAYLGFVPDMSNSTCAVVKDTDVTSSRAPDTFDWRDKKAVTPIKDQGYCGSCYAFSAVGNVESQYAIKNGAIVDLSEQQLLDCSKRNNGCNGGWMDVCMDDIKNEGGIEAESDYPYKAANGTCTFKRSLAKVKLSGCTNYQLLEENKVKEALVKVGPLSIAVDGSTMQLYNKGIIKKCTAELSHGVLLVGYGTEKGEDYWIIKNSWGTLWGESGYCRVTRNTTACPMLNKHTVSAILA